MRKSSVFLGAVAVMAALLVVCLLHAWRAAAAARPAVARRAATVKALGLTDLCLFTDAAYTRHLALADVHAPLQEHPLSLEHFPAGSLAGPRESLRR
ncbi:MAG TPA: hypothetical protein VI078_12255 [bacterium]